jgi:DNA polymerase family A
MSGLLDAFREIWAVDFEFQSTPGERAVPVCLVASELRTGRKLRIWHEDFGTSPPYSIAANSLFIAYYASAELGCHLSLGWPMPARVLDLFVEFRCLTNGEETPAGNSLLGALTYYGLDNIGGAEKDEMRNLVLRQGPRTREEEGAILAYCESDVSALARLLPRMLPRIDLSRALLRGRYMAAAASMESVGVPIEVELLERLRTNWTSIQDRLITAIDADYHVYDGRTFKRDRFERLLVAHQIAWPLLESGQLDLSRSTFRDMAKIHPVISPLHELRHALSEMRLNELAVGKDGCNRCMLSVFRSKTSRNQPSNTKYIFGHSVWLRSLIKPPPGWGVAYLDWVQQEFGIAAALSCDPNMMEAYQTGDSYLAFAKQAGVVPNDATKETHSLIRDQFKQCVLGVQYGIAERSLAVRIGQLPIVARHLLRLHHEVYHVFWRWSDTALDHAMLCGWQSTVFGWCNRVFPNPNPRSIRNFHIQANGAEMLRLACCLGTENGIRICAPVHDAVLIAAPISELEAHVTAMRDYMEQASSIVLAGFKLATESKVVLYPNRYADPRGEKMFAKVMSLL